MADKFHFDEAAVEAQLREVYRNRDCNWAPRQMESYVQFSLWILTEMANGAEPSDLLERVSECIATMILGVDSQVVAVEEKGFAADLLTRVDDLVFDATPQQRDFVRVRIEPGGHA